MCGGFATTTWGIIAWIDWHWIKRISATVQHIDTHEYDWNGILEVLNVAMTWWRRRRWRRHRRRSCGFRDCCNLLRGFFSIFILIFLLYANRYICQPVCVASVVGSIWIVFYLVQHHGRKKNTKKFLTKLVAVWTRLHKLAITMQHTRKMSMLMMMMAKWNPKKNFKSKVLNWEKLYTHSHSHMQLFWCVFVFTLFT